MKRSVAKHVYEYGLLALGTLALGVGLHVFLLPLDLSAGGVTTLGAVILHLTKIPLSVTNLVANVVLFALAFRFLSKGSFVKTIVGVLLLSLSLELTSRIPATFINGIINENSAPIMASICGGVTVGIGLGLIIRSGGSTGGTDLAGLLVKRFMPHVSVTLAMFIMDMIVVIISGVVFRSFEVTFYSLVAIFITSKVADFITNLGDAAKSIYVISEKSSEITALVMGKYDRGLTEIYSKGGYSGKDRPMLLCVVTPKQAPRLVKDIKELDPSAFVIICDAREVLGEGFKNP